MNLWTESKLVVVEVTWGISFLLGVVGISVSHFINTANRRLIVEKMKINTDDGDFCKTSP